MSASISPRESKTKRVVQFASGGAAYDPDFVSNGSKAERIAYIRDVNAKTAAKQADASGASNGTTTTLEADASPASASSATPAAVATDATKTSASAKGQFASGAAPNAAAATAAGHASANTPAATMAAGGRAAEASPAAAGAGGASAGPGGAARAAASGAGGPAAGPATPAAMSRAGVPVAASTSAGSATVTPQTGGDESGGGSGAGKAAKIAAGVVAGVAVTGLVAFTASRLAARARQTVLMDTLTRSFADSSVCHLFVSPRTTLSPHRSPACTEAEAYLRLAKIAYTAHYVEHGSDLAGALARMDKTVQDRIVRTWTAKGKASYTQTPTTATSPPPPAAAGSDGGDRLSSEVQDDLTYLLEGGALPVMVYREEVICMGSRAIIDYCADAFDVKLDAVFSQSDRALGVSIRKQAAYSLPLFLRRTFNDHGKAWALMEGQQRGAAVPLLTGWYHVWKDRVCRAPMNYAISHHTSIGAQSRVQYETAFQKEVVALEQTLGQKAYMLGFTPSSYDCAVYATLLPLMYVDEATVAGLNSALTYIRSSEPLKAYVRRFSELVFPDIESLLKHATWMGRAGEEETFDYQTAASASRSNARSVPMLSSPRETVNARAAEASSSRSVTTSASATPPAKTRAAPLAPASAPPASKETAAIDDIDEL